ncbi:hypothetical protein [Micromonospora sp. NBS 11-29]|uniref:hypothetical protein n=1 Tax=Micromonospora sp. NBS 11-29 TaxID=1960879 RepID=UPI000B790077|nr:hypothetical protein [Micromonospora sp. NBS 11-29]
MIWIEGHQYGTAAEIATALGPDITAARVRDWARRAANPADPLYGLLHRHHVAGRGRGSTWYRYDEAAHMEFITRSTKGGPARVGRWGRPSKPS